MSASCSECGAPHEPGYVLCKYCKAPYGDDLLRGAFPCPSCTTFNLAGAARCVSCGAAFVAHAGGSGVAVAPIHAGPVRTRRRHGHVSRSTTVTLTDGKLLFSSGNPAIIDLRLIEGVREDHSFNGETWGGNSWVIVRAGGEEHGFMVKQAEARTWLDALAPRG